MRRLDVTAAGVCRWVLLGLFSVAAGSRGRAQAGTSYLAEYHAVVTFASPMEASFVTRVRLEPGRLPDRLLLVHYPGQELSQVSVRNAQSAIPFTTAEVPGAVVLRLVAAEQGSIAGALEVQYSVRSRSRLERVPLPILQEPPRPEQLPVLIEANLSAGMIAVGEGFPTLTWRKPGHGETRLAAVPSLLAVETRMAGSVSWGDRLLTPAALSTAAMFGLLLVGSVAWYARTQSLAGRTKA